MINALEAEKRNEGWMRTENADGGRYLKGFLESLLFATIDYFLFYLEYVCETKEDSEASLKVT